MTGLHFICPFMVGKVYENLLGKLKWVCDIAWDNQERDSLLQRCAFPCQSF